MARPALAFVACQLIAAAAIACTPPLPLPPGTQAEPPDVTIDKLIARNYAQADAVFLARVVRVTQRQGETGQVEMSQLKPRFTYKGRAGEGPAVLEKMLGHTCDQRPFAHQGDQVLVFARGKAELVRFTPRQDIDPYPPGIRPYERALRYVQQQSGVHKP